MNYYDVPSMEWDALVHNYMNCCKPGARDIPTGGLELIRSSGTNWEGEGRGIFQYTKDSHR